jgi:hypothetical protein
MKVRIKRTILVEVVKPRLQEVWDKPLERWQELFIETLDLQGKTANLTDYSGDTYLSVPVDAFEVVA